MWNRRIVKRVKREGRGGGSQRKGSLKKKEMKSLPILFTKRKN
jgi:hypothetical protein